MFTKEELLIMHKLIERVEIKGAEAIPTAVLLQKLEKLIKTPVEAPQKEEEKSS